MSKVEYKLISVVLKRFEFENGFLNFGKLYSVIFYSYFILINNVNSVEYNLFVNFMALLVLLLFYEFLTLLKFFFKKCLHIYFFFVIPYLNTLVYNFNYVNST